MTAAEAGRLIDRTLGDGELRRLLAESGGNPFHLMQLARTPRPGVARDRDPGRAEVPEAVREAVLSETAPLGAAARALLDGAAIVGDPFEIDFAAEVAGLEHEAALEALDVLVAADLVQITGEVRRFRFRHPIVRRTVYETIGQAGGWPATRAPPRASNAPVRDRPRWRTTWSSPPLRATAPRSSCSPRRRARSAAAPRRPPSTGSRSRGGSCRARSRSSRCWGRWPARWPAPDASTRPSASCWTCSRRCRRTPRRASS